MKLFSFRLIFLFLFLGHFLAAQNPSRVTVRGQVHDTTGVAISYATVMLLSPKDTTLVNFTRSDDKGFFAFKNIKNVPYLLKISYISYLPYAQDLPPAATEVNDVGVLKIKPISNELMEVVIKAAKAPLRIRGDTIEYDASTFKVPPGSTVEDLLRRLPGVEVDADGNIRAQGQDVKRVYVDGKTFFGDDPKSATKNLGAETISKVQVYNEKSEQSKLTGVDDGKKEKAMNLELKEEFKKGSFGKLTAAVGTEERWAARGNYNRFNSKQQLSFIGYGNNINQTGVNWEDYGEFKGQNTFNENDNGDFGFSAGGGRYYYFADDDSPLNHFDGRGFTKNFGGGANYNYDHKKTKYNVSYFYNESALTLDQFAYRQTFLSDNSFSNADTINELNFRGNHSLGTRLEQNLDSNNILIIKANARISGTNSDFNQSQLFYREGEAPTNRLSIDNDNELDSWRVSGSAIFRHRFKKKGRSVAVSAGYNNSQSDGLENLSSINRFFEATSFSEQIRQLNTNENATVQYKSSLLFTEPLSKKWFWESFYNYNQTVNEVNRQVTDPEVNNEPIRALSVFYKNDVLYNRLGSSIRYSFKGLNVAAGLAGQQITLKGEYATDRDEPLLAEPVNRTFTNWTPNLGLSYEFPSNVWLNMDYSYVIREPRLGDLQPVPNVNNPAFRTEGNPNLVPERSHSVSLNVNHWNPATFANVGLGANFNRYENQIIYNQTIQLVDSIGIVTTSRPDNLPGGTSFNTYLWSGFPIVKTKLTLNVSGDVNIGTSPSYVNGIRNDTRSNGFGIQVGLNATPNQTLILSANGNLNFTDITYSIQQEQNQKIRNYGVDASIKWQFLSRFFLESNFNYDVYRNDRFGFDRDIPIWNASVRRLFGSSNRFEVRLAAFDLFNRRVSISQYGSQNYVSRSIANTLARYYMLSLSYNMRGYENKLNKNNWW